MAGIGIGELGIVIATIAVIFGGYYILRFIFYITACLNDYIFDVDNNLFVRLISTVIWIPLIVFCTIFIFIGILCGVSLAKEAANWFFD